MAFRHMRKTKQGTTLVEVLVASSLSVMVVFTTLGIFMSGMSDWARGQGRIDAESQSQAAVRQISDTLREAMAVSVDADGQGLRFRLPAKGEDGSFRVPAVWDGVERRIYHQSGKLMLAEGGRARELARGVILTDPNSPYGDASYRIFSPNTGTVVRQLTVMVATRTNGAAGEKVTGRTRETVYLRNIPDLYR